MRISTTLKHLFAPDTASSSQPDPLASLLVIAGMVEARDPSTGGHLWRISRYAELLAAPIGMREADLTLIGRIIKDATSRATLQSMFDSLPGNHPA